MKAIKNCQLGWHNSMEISVTNSVDFDI